MRARALVHALVSIGALSCASPIVDVEVHEVDPKSLTRIAVVPFLPASDFRGSGEPGVSTGGEAAEAAALATRSASDAFAAAGFEVIPASDVVQVFAASGKPVPHGDQKAFTEVAAREFGATAALFGTVHSYRERRGGELGATRPASVGFELALRTAPGDRMLWTARFDHTQQALSENALEARRYPGAGTRWLSAAELTRWGFDAAAEDLSELR
jgi:hypothetical protein